MDGETLRWILDFLVRSSIPDDLLKKIIAVIPFPDIDSSLRKAFLLRIIQAELSKASVSETHLEILEMIEDLDMNDGMEIMDSMRAAYCAVAVESTVKYFAVCPENNEECVKAFKRIWRRRMSYMEELEGRSELIGEEFKQWRNKIEDVVWDFEARGRLGNVNTRKDASDKIGEYLKEAWETMGPVFLESIGRLMKAKNLAFSDEEGDTCINSEANLDGESRGNVVGRTRNTPEMDRYNIGGNVVEVDDGARVRLDQGCRADIGIGFNSVTVNLIDVQGIGDHQTGQQIEERIDKTKGLSVNDIPANEVAAIHKGNLLLKKKQTAYRKRCKAIKISIPEDEEAGREAGSSHNNHDLLPSYGVKKVQESLKCSSLDLQALVKDPLPDALRMSEFARSELETRNINELPHIDNTKGLSVNDVHANEVAAIQKGNLLHKQKYPAYHKCFTDIKISLPEEEEADGEAGSSHNNHDLLPGYEVKDVREALLFSSLELQALVKDPLPDALRMSEFARSELEKRNINEEPHIGNQRNVPQGSLLERNNTAHAYEWDDSIDESPKGSSNFSSRLHAPSSIKNKVSPLKKYAFEKFTKRRKIKKWTLIEEDTLREGIQKFGAGSWKLILNSYRDIFEERTEVDLKDKWRNMTRYNTMGKYRIVKGYLQV